MCGLNDVSCLRIFNDVNIFQLIFNLFLGHWWIGLSDRNKEGSFQLLLGQLLVFTNWIQGPPTQPDDLDNNRKLDVDCASLNPFY